MAKLKTKSKIKSKIHSKISKKETTDSTCVDKVDDNTIKINIFKENMKKIIDPHTGVNIVDMGMVQNILVKDGKVSLDFIPTSPFCPVVNYFVEEMKKAAKNAGFSDCKVNLKI